MKDQSSPPPWIRQQSLPITIAFLVVVVIASVWGLLGWKALGERQATFTRSAGNMQNLARSLAEHAARTIEGVDIILRGVVERLNYEGYGVEQTERMDRLLAMRASTLPAIRELVVLNKTGRWAFSSLPTLPTHENGDREYFLFHQRDPSLDLRINDPLKSRLTDKWTLLLTRRVNDRDGNFAGVVGAAIDLGYFQKFYQTFNVGQKGNIAIYRSDATLLVRHPLDTAEIGRNLSAFQLFRKEIATAPNGYFSIDAPFDQVARRVAFDRLPDFPIVVSVARAESEILAQWQDNVRTDFAIAAVLSALMILLGAVVAMQLRSRARAEAMLRLSEARFRLLADNAGDVVISLDPSGIRRYVSPAIEQVLGWKPEELIGKSALELADPDHRKELEEVIASFAQGQERARLVHRTRRKDGTFIWVESTFKLVHDIGNDASNEARAAIVVVLRDVSQRHEMEDELRAANQQLQALATTDALTGLPNRRSFDLAWQRECRRAARSKSALCLILIDIDNFKKYNDRYGHPRGDECLRRVAKAMAQALRRPGDIVARYGGEEFAVILPETDEAGGKLVAETLRAAVYDLALDHRGSSSKRITISLGIAHAALGPDNDGSELVPRADQALYEAKGRGRNLVACSSEITPSQFKVA